MGSTPYLIPQYDGPGFAERLVSLVPAQWSSDTAKAPGGVLYSLLEAVGGELSLLESGLVYGQQSIYLTQATGSALDLAVADFFGATLTRAPGESDASFRTRALAALFQPMATEAALVGALTRLTGVPPRIIEPWSPADTGYWDGFYWDVDTVETPFRWTGSFPYQGFIETILPLNAQTLGNNPISGWDASFFWDAPGAFLGDLTLAGGGAQSVRNLIESVKPEGVVAWLKIT